MIFILLQFVLHQSFNVLIDKRWRKYQELWDNKTCLKLSTGLFYCHGCRPCSCELTFLVVFVWYANCDVWSPAQNWGFTCPSNRLSTSRGSWLERQHSVKPSNKWEPIGDHVLKACSAQSGQLQLPAYHWASYWFTVALVNYQDWVLKTDLGNSCR